MEEILDALATTNYGVVARKDLELFLPGHCVEYAIRVRRLVPLHTGVYRVTGAPISIESSIYAATIAAPGTAVASHTSALVLHGLLPGHGHEITVTTAIGANNKRSGIRIYRAPVPDGEIEVTRGIRTTNIERSLLDASSILPAKTLARVLDDAIVRGLTTYSRVHKSFLRWARPGRKGVRALRMLLEERLSLAEGHESPLELRLIRIVAKAKIIQPTLQYTLRDGGRRYFLDAAWPDWKIAIESDGFNNHGHSRKRFD